LTMEINIRESKVEARFSEPNQSQIFELDKFYRKIFSECIREGIMTEAEAKKRFAESGAWTKEEETEIQVLIQKLAFNSAKLGLMKELNDESSELISSIQEDRSEMFELISRKTELLSNTAEGMANEQKVFKYIALCLCDKEGLNLFGSEEELEKYASDNSDDFSVVVQEAYSIVYGVDYSKDLTADWAEVQFLIGIEEGSKDNKKKPKKTKKKSPKKKQ
jgi:hypothetical protein